MTAQHGDPDRPAPVPVPAEIEARLAALAAQLDARPDDAFRAGTRARLVAMAAVRPPGPPSRGRSARRGRTPRWRRRLVVAVVGLGLTVAALTAFAQWATPGDAQPEQGGPVQPGDERGLALLGRATSGLDELGTLAAAPAGVDPVLVDRTLDSLDTQTAEGARLVTTRVVQGADPAALDVLEPWAVQQWTGLSALVGQLPPQVDARVRQSLDVVTEVRVRAVTLRAAVDCPGGPAVDGVDRWGPVPAACDDRANRSAARPAPTTPR